MSAVSSNSSERELEALRRAQRAYEPSMEEILASIRTIIADERAPPAADPPMPAPPRASPSASGPQIVYSKDAPVAQRVAEEPPPTGQAPETDRPAVIPAQPRQAASDLQQDAASGGDEPLLSPEAGAAVASAFGGLSAQLAARSAEVADQMVREMLRPMLKAWLDENLPGIVERLVGAEIERLARGTR